MKTRRSFQLFHIVLFAGLLSLWWATGCQCVRRTGVVRFWADYNTLEAPAFFVEEQTNRNCDPDCFFKKHCWIDNRRMCPPVGFYDAREFRPESTFSDSVEVPATEKFHKQIDEQTSPPLAPPTPPQSLTPSPEVTSPNNAPNSSLQSPNLSRPNSTSPPTDQSQPTPQVFSDQIPQPMPLSTSNQPHSRSPHPANKAHPLPAPSQPTAPTQTAPQRKPLPSQQDPSQQESRAPVEPLPPQPMFRGPTATAPSNIQRLSFQLNKPLSNEQHSSDLKGRKSWGRPSHRAENHRASTSQLKRFPSYAKPPLSQTSPLPSDNRVKLPTGAWLFSRP